METFLFILTAGFFALLFGALAFGLIRRTVRSFQRWRRGEADEDSGLSLLEFPLGALGVKPRALNPKWADPLLVIIIIALPFLILWIAFLIAR